MTATGTKLCSSRIFWDTQRRATRNGTRGSATEAPLLPSSTLRLIPIVFALTKQATTGLVLVPVKIAIAVMHRAEIIQSSI